MASTADNELGEENIADNGLGVENQHDLSEVDASEAE